MRSAVEFHDSTVSAIEAEGTGLRISVDAYVHRWEQIDGQWKGIGWIQPIVIFLTNTSDDAEPACPLDLAGGDVRTDQTTYGLVPLPFDSFGPATLRLELVTGKVLEFEADALTTEATGEGRFVEDLPTISGHLMPSNPRTWKTDFGRANSAGQRTSEQTTHSRVHALT